MKGKEGRAGERGVRIAQESVERKGLGESGRQDADMSKERGLASESD